MAYIFSDRGGRRLRWLTPLIAIAALALAAFLLHRIFSRYSVDEIAASVAATPPMRVALAAVFAAASYLCLTGFDTLATRYVGRTLPYRNCALASFTALSIGHNVGLAALSSGAIRYRFYARWGLSLEEIAKLILFCATTVGLGLMTLAGAALLLRADLAQRLTGLERPALVALGATCLALAALHLCLSAALRRPLRLGKWSLALPGPRLAAAQIVIGAANFAFVAACLHQALSAAADIAYLGVAAAYVIANAAALIAHVPGGLGVIESVIMFLLPQADLIGALVVFRVVYFLVPLCVGLPLLAITELALRRSNPGAAPARRASDGSRSARAA